MTPLPPPSVAPAGGPTWMRLAAGLLRSSAPRTILVASLMALLGLVEGVGLLLLVPLLGLAGLDVRVGALGPIEEGIRGAFRAAGLVPDLAGVLLAYVAVVAVHAFLELGAEAASADLQAGFVSGLRKRLYRALCGCSWAGLSRMRASDCAHALTSESERAGVAAHHLLAAATAGVLTLVYAGLSLRVSPALAAPALLGAALLGAGLRRRARRSRGEGEEVSRTGRDLHAALLDGLGGAKTRRSQGADDRDADRFADLSDRLAAGWARVSRGYAATRLLGTVGAAAILAAGVWLAVEVLAVPVATLLLLLFLSNRLFSLVFRILDAVQGVEGEGPGLAAILDLEARAEASAEPAGGPPEPVVLREGIRLAGVSFSWGGDDRAPALRDVSLEIPAGSAVALVGPSGAGKTTLADVLGGLLVPDRGSLEVDGVPLGPERLRAWREQVGYVGQDVFLLHDTLRANLLWARPGASEGEMLRALGRADARELLARLPRGLDTVVGDRGSRLSGGERQRVALARALLRRPALLVLDEATGSLDPRGEGRILSALERLRGEVTVLLVTHRRSVSAWADRVYVVEAGTVRPSAPRRAGGIPAPAPSLGPAFADVRTAGTAPGGR